MIYILYLIIGLFLGALILYCLLHKKIKQTNFINDEIAEENKKIEEENYLLLTQQNKLKNNNEVLTNSINYLLKEKTRVSDNLKELEQLADKAVTDYYNQCVQTANNNFENYMVGLSERYQQNEEEYEKEYLKTLAEYMQNFSDATESASIKLKEMEDALAEYQSKINSAVAAAKRAEEMRTEKDFYRIQLSDIDLHEIEILKDIVSVLRDKESFNKVIWKCYYEKPTSDLIGRVIGSGTHTGIYKITHIDSERCYVGQAVNLAGEKLYPMTVGGLLI